MVTATVHHGDQGAIALNAKAKQQQMQNLLDSLPPSEQPGALDEDDDDEGDDAEDDDEAALEGEPMEGETDEDAYARIKGKWKAARVGVTGAAQVSFSQCSRKRLPIKLLPTPPYVPT